MHTPTHNRFEQHWLLLVHGLPFGRQLMMVSPALSA